MGKYIITLLFITNLFSQAFDYRESNRIRKDLMSYDKIVIEKTNFRNEEELIEFISNNGLDDWVIGLPITK